MVNEKRTPIEERLARMFAPRSTFRDFRDGTSVATTPRTMTPDVELAAQLGYIQREHGIDVVMALETHYGSTLIHERHLRRSWDRRCLELDQAGYDDEAAVLSRWGGAIAIRQFAGATMSTAEVNEYAWLIRVRKGTLSYAVWIALGWLEELRATGLDALHRAFSVRAA